jgi:hypothetical protein
VEGGKGRGGWGGGTGVRMECGVIPSEARDLLRGRRSRVSRFLVAGAPRNDPE